MITTTYDDKTENVDFRTCGAYGTVRMWAGVYNEAGLSLGVLQRITGLASTMWLHTGDVHVSVEWGPGAEYRESKDARVAVAKMSTRLGGTKTERIGISVYGGTLAASVMPDSLRDPSSKNMRKYRARKACSAEMAQDLRALYEHVESFIANGGLAYVASHGADGAKVGLPN